MNIKEAIKKIISDNSMSAERLAKKMGFARASTITNIFMRGDLKVSMLFKICEAMDYELVLKPKGNGRETIKITEIGDVTDNRKYQL